MWKVISSWSLQVFVEKCQNDYNNSPITKPKQYIFATLYLIYDAGGIFIAYYTPPFRINSSLKVDDHGRTLYYSILNAFSYTVGVL